jgi:4-amino-4-deoxy-L-arabinose transferase-like glycosyltransferase
MTVRKLTTYEQWVGAVLCVAYVMALVWTAPDLAMSRDESFYAHAAKDYGAWIAELLTNPDSALSREHIDRAWDYNWEHPAWMKLTFAWSSLVHQKLGIYSSESLAFRFPGMLTAGLLLWLIYAWGVVTIGRVGALVAALVFALMPRVFYHSHLAAFDVPIAFFLTLTAYAYWRTLSDHRWALITGLAFGLALATKHNSWMLPGIFLVHYLWVRRKYALADRFDRPTVAWLPSMLVLGPMILIATWPWVWHNTLGRLLAYAKFHLQHVHYTYEYLGTSYFESPLPMSVPFVMTLFTVPLTFLALAVVGLVYRRAAFAPPRKTQRGDPADTNADLLWLGCLVAPLVAIALPSSPIFGGTKHWIASYPFLALFAGWGFVAVVEGATRALFAERRWPVWALAGVCLAPGVVQTAHSHPFALSHYTPIAGGVPGAADLGMNRQFWGFTTGSLASFIAKTLPDGGTVWTCDMTWGAWKMMQADQRLPSDIRPARSMTDADLVLVHHEPHFNEVDFQAWMAFDDVQPVHVLTYDGVPLISVYENKRSSRRLE